MLLMLQPIKMKTEQVSSSSPLAPETPASMLPRLHGNCTPEFTDQCTSCSMRASICEKRLDLLTLPAAAKRVLKFDEEEEEVGRRSSSSNAADSPAQDSRRHHLHITKYYTRRRKDIPRPPNLTPKESSMEPPHQAHHLECQSPPAMEMDVEDIVPMETLTPKTRAKKKSIKYSKTSTQGYSENNTTSFDPVSTHDKNMIGPFEGPSTPAKKRLPRAKAKAKAKVDLDAETEKLWHLLMEKEGRGAAAGKTYSDDEKMGDERRLFQNMEDERRLFRDRALLFISHINSIQGRKRFSQWKGSVVDSVVGVFLTQNVSDVLSSSAFMSLAARFPLQSSGSNGDKKESSDTRDTVDWEAVRCADVSEISESIRGRGQNNVLAERIKVFLNRLVNEQGRMDLEWLRDIPPEKAKDYLLNIRGLGPKSVECVRLLSLRQHAFPVDVNIGRICVRLGWVPLQPLPESIQLDLLEKYPFQKEIQKYLWPRLCKLDQEDLYELHYQMITFGKVFSTKKKPNCNACPVKLECKHFASAHASAKLALPCPGDRDTGSSNFSIPTHFPQLEGTSLLHGHTVNNCQPIIEEPSSPEPEHTETSETAMEDFYMDPDEIPTIKLNIEGFKQNLWTVMTEDNMESQQDDMLKALVAISPEVALIPLTKLKYVNRLRTEHRVYELPDSHPLLAGMDQRQPDDPNPYLLAIWTPGEASQLTQPPEIFCNSHETGHLCVENTCSACSTIREARELKVKGTILIPCRTALRGRFPLNGTYFQVNEVFADHQSSHAPIDVSRELIWNLSRRTVYFGTSITAIFRGLTAEDIQQNFWSGFVCVRGFDRRSKSPHPLASRLHSTASKRAAINED